MFLYTFNKIKSIIFFLYIQDLEGTYKEKKSDYDKIMVGSESEITNLENQVKKLQDEYEKEE